MFSRHKEPLPAGAAEANWFSLFNAISWQITLGSPLIVYAKNLGASSTLLGVLAALTPLLVILQLPAAHLLPRYGYRKLIMAGWGARTVCIFGLAVVPLLTFLDAASRLALVLLLLFVFNLMRGMASGAWMPWMTGIIPEKARARFLSRDQFFAQMGCMAALGMSAYTLSQEPRAWQFSIVFLFSAVGATMSLFCLTRIPDVTAPEELRASGTPVPWMHMLGYPPLLRLIIFNLLFVVALGGLGVFSIAFLRAEAGYSERLIVSLSMLSVTGAILTLPFAARVLDRTGSRPVLVLCLVIFAVVLIGWFCISAGVMGRPSLVVAVLMTFSGMTGVNYAVANSRLAMATIPVMGRNHFFAIYTVITSMAAGLSPIAWGDIA